MKKFIGITICLWVFVTTGFAQVQTTKIENGPGTKGEIIHSSPLHDSLLPQNGKLEIRWSVLEENKIHAYQINGQTNNHLPVGKWKWEEGSWNYQVTIGQEALPGFNTFGIRNKWAGNFKNAVQDGPWEFWIDSISNSGKTINNIAKIQINYQSGIPVGNFVLERNIKGNALKLNGVLNKNGLANGIWKLQYFQNGQLIKEEKHYDNGLLLQVKIEKGTEKTVQEIASNLQYLNANKDNNEAIIIGEQLFYDEENATLGSDLVMDLFNNAFQNGWKLSAFPYEVKMAIPAFKRLAYPLKNTDSIAIAASQSMIGNQKAAIDQSLSGNINIHRARSGNLDTTITFLQLQHKRLELLDSLLNRTNAPLFKYKNRHQQGLQGWQTLLNEQRTGTGTVYDSLNVTINKVDFLQNNESVFQDIQKLLTHNESVFPAYFKVIEEAKSSLHREGQLKALEDTITAQYTSLQNHYSDKNGSAGIIYNKWLKGDIQQLLQVFATTTNHDSALQIGNKISNYLDTLSHKKDIVSMIDSMPIVLKSQYTHFVYNPYTGASDIEMVVKKRFLNNVLQTMWPYMEQELNATNDWNTWNEMWNRRIAIYNYLLAFIPKEDKQSKRFENKIRNERKAEKMYKSFLQQLD